MSQNEGILRNFILGLNCECDCIYLNWLNWFIFWIDLIFLNPTNRLKSKRNPNNDWFHVRKWNILFQTATKIIKSRLGISLEFNKKLEKIGFTCKTINSKWLRNPAVFSAVQTIQKLISKLIVLFPNLVIICSNFFFEFIVKFERKWKKNTSGRRSLSFIVFLAC